MNSSVRLLDWRPQRWQSPFGSDMTDVDVERVLAHEPFRSMDQSRFPANTSLADIIRYDARLLKAEPGQILVRAGDYGNSAFGVLTGQVRVALDDLPVDLLGRSQPKRKSFLQAFSQLWSNSRIPEERKLERETQIETSETHVSLTNVGEILESYKTAPIGSGALFGELAALGRIPRTATVFADQETELLEIRWQGLREISRFNAEFRSQIDKQYRENALQRYLSETPLFEKVPDETIEEIIDSILFETYGSFDWNVNFKSKKGKEPVIAEQGDYPDGLLLVRAGFARVSIALGAGKRTITYLGAGDIFGLHEVYEQSQGKESKLETSLSALGYVDVLRIPLPILEEHVFPHIEIPKQRLSDGAMDTLGDNLAVDWLVENRFINATQAMVIDLDKCVRCDDCVRACSSTHDGNPRFKRHGKTFENWMVTNACMHCTDPVCMIGCPTGAIHRSVHGGEVIINDQTCIGCGTCANSCPYDNISLVEIADNKGLAVVDPQSQKPIRKATKCDLCHTNPGGPACVQACPHDALFRVDFGNSDLITSGPDNAK